MAINLQPPADAEIEISLFGPGTGECIVAHLGQGDWMIVDSCIANNSGKPVALEYLESIGVSFDQVKIVLISHFHDDHIRGIAQVIECCAQAQVCISDALTQSESISYVLAHSQGESFFDRGKPSVHEIKKIIDFVSANGRGVIWVSEAKLLYRNDCVQVNALSPSDGAVSQSRLDFAQAFEETKNGFRKLAKKLSPNLCAVALHICNGHDTVLLGSDLEVSGTPLLGWEAVVASTRKPRTLARLFKVAHHGSRTGHSDDVVNTMLGVKPVSIVTSMNVHHLPLPEDLERIKRYSECVYHTTQPLLKAPKRDRVVEEMMATVVKRRRVVSGSMGHIQVRLNHGAMVIETNSHASQAA
ncbi:MBL fold metallo-hydrolase [Azotobacter chroococcum]|uniref:MBL fold metallo-hydrolase n=1 Tax=Azotobacter chroococcum TaxID=353 RepID=UPI0013F15479|nr:MBL fold metallo-hydrolase [Azotobacter chroococcum]